MAALAYRLAQDTLALGPNRGRISLSLAKPLWECAWERAKRAGITERSEVVRGIILAAAIDAGLDLPRAGGAAVAAATARGRGDRDLCLSVLLACAAPAEARWADLLSVARSPEQKPSLCPEV